MKEALSDRWKRRADDFHLRSRWRWGRGGQGESGRTGCGGSVVVVVGAVVVVAGIEIEASTDGDGMLRGAEVRRGLRREGKGHAEESPPPAFPDLTSRLPPPTCSRICGVVFRLNVLIAAAADGRHSDSNPFFLEFYPGLLTRRTAKESAPLRLQLCFEPGTSAAVVGRPGLQGRLCWPELTQKNTFSPKYANKVILYILFFPHHIMSTWLPCFHCWVLRYSFYPIISQLACVVRSYEICLGSSEPTLQVLVRSQ